MPDGDVLDATSGAVIPSPGVQPALLALARCAALCNDSTLYFDEAANAPQHVGENTEVALRVLAEKVMNHWPTHLVVLIPAALHTAAPHICCAHCAALTNTPDWRARRERQSRGGADQGAAHQPVRRPLDHRAPAAGRVGVFARPQDDEHRQQGAARDERPAAAADQGGA